jgi:nephrocystin-3
MASSWQTRPVFISSTFRDMHSERDWLVKRVFPALREKLEPHRVHLVDIDLRWGVTKEQSDNSGALDICLKQVDECKPFFLGILGEYYGWVSPKIPERVFSTWGWIQKHTDKSITELEILYGVLNNKAMERHALFCLRDPAFLAGVPAEFRGSFESESPESKKKLDALKDAIRKSGHPVLENYPCRYAGQRRGRAGGVRLEGLEEFGKRVHDWLWKAILNEYKLSEQPAAGDPLDEELGHHERFMESRLRVYIGRESLQKTLTSFADGADEVPCLVTGPSGSGKSAALAKFAVSYAASHPGAVVIPHFVGASPASTSLRSMLQRLSATLKREFGFTPDVPADTNSLITTFRQFVAEAPKERRVVMILDALNQMDEADNAQRLSWLPWKFPPHVKMIVSCINDPGREEPVLKAFEHREHKHVPVEPLTTDERGEIVREVPSLSAKALDPKQIALLLDNPATANPLFLLVALEELRGFGSYEQLNARIQDLPREGDAVTELFRQVIDRLKEDFDPVIVETVLTLLASARRGLSDREFLDLAEGPAVQIDQSASDLFPLVRQLRPYLQRRGELWDFFHRNLFKAVREFYLSGDEARSAAHDRLAKYFAAQDYFLESLEQQRARAKRLPPTPRPANVRKVGELSYQLLEVAKLRGKDDPTSPHWNAVVDLLTDLHFLEAKVEAVE